MALILRKMSIVDVIAPLAMILQFFNYLPDLLTLIRNLSSIFKELSKTITCENNKKAQL